MTLFDQVYDLSSINGDIQAGIPGQANGFVILFEEDAAASATGTVAFYLGAPGLVNRLANVSAKTIRTGTIDKQQTQFTLVPSSGATGWVRIKLTQEGQPEASYTL